MLIRGSISYVWYVARSVICSNSNFSKRGCCVNNNAQTAIPTTTTIALPMIRVLPRSGWIIATALISNKVSIFAREPVNIMPITKANKLSKKQHVISL